MIKIPDVPVIQPEISNIVNFKNSTLFIISIIVEIANISISIFSLKDIDILYKVIIVLSITILILFVDVIVLYIKDRENHFEKIYLSNMYKFLVDNIKDNQKNMSDLKNQVNKLNNVLSVKQNKS